MLGVSIGTGTTTITTATAVGMMRQTNSDPIIGVLVGSASAIAICALILNYFLSQLEK
jgi:Flp pilus assembly CpaE family ATPase